MPAPAARPEARFSRMEPSQRRALLVDAMASNVQALPVAIAS